MRLGYSFWGYQCDTKVKGGREVSTPDGNATYSWSIIWEAKRRGWPVYLMQEDRDSELTGGWMTSGEIERHFSSFSCEKRAKAYAHPSRCAGVHYDSLPDIDALLVEWRWPIPGRNCGIDKTEPSYQPDLDRQTELLNYYYNKGTAIILWDLDHKLTAEDERRWSPDAIFETSVSPRELTMRRTRVEAPFVVNDLAQHRMRDLGESSALLTYVGSRYERDDVIDEYVRPVSDLHPGRVEFYGNWTDKGHIDFVRAMWPNISFKDRICVRGFLDAYSRSAACPLLAKRSYLESGFMTPRIWECMLFGSLPIGLAEFNGIDQYLPDELIASDADDLAEKALRLSSASLAYRECLRSLVISMIGRMDVSKFVDRIQDIVTP